MPEKKAPSKMAPQPGVPERKQDLERERRALRDLITGAAGRSALTSMVNAPSRRSVIGLDLGIGPKP